MSPVEIMSALVAPVTSSPAPSAGEGDAGAFKQAMDAVANDAETPARADAPAPKKGFLNSAKLAAANAAVTEASAGDDIEAPAAPAVAVTPTPTTDDAGAEADAGAVAADPEAPAADAAAPATDGVPSLVVPPAPAAPETAPAAAASDKDEGDADSDAGVAAVERTLAALLDRVLTETGAADQKPDADQLKAAKAAIDSLLDQAPPQMRAKFEAMLARLAAAVAETDTPATPAEPEAPAQTADPDQGEPEPVQSLRMWGGDLIPLSRQGRPTVAGPTYASSSSAAGAPAPTPHEVGRDEATLDVPAAPAAPEAAKPGGDASPSANAAASSTPSPASSKAAATPEPATAVAAAQSDPTVNPAAPTDTAAGAPAAHAGSHAVVAEAVRGSPETVAHLSAEILKKFGERSTRFDVELHPADMGRVDVRLTIEADGRLKAQMAFDNPVAAADLRARADELRRSLEQAGFQVSDDSFSFADRNNGGGAFEDARQQFADGGRARARAFRAGEQAASLADAPPVARRAVRLGVDVRI